MIDQKDLAKIKKVLILCTGNSCRSQMAEALINFRLGKSWEAISAGTEPSTEVHPLAIRALSEIGISHSGNPKRVEEILDVELTLAITVCDDADKNCPVWPGQGRRVHMPFPDPANAVGTDKEKMRVFRQVRDAIDEQLLDYLRSIT